MKKLDDSLIENYTRGGFVTKLSFGKSPALVVIDFVKAYLLPESPLFGGEGCINAHRGALELLRAARAAAIPVIHTNVAFERGGRNGGVFFRKVPALASFEEGRHPLFAEFADGLEPLADETVITKQYASAFFGTTLASTLTAQHIDTIILAGVSTSGCVRATAVDGCQHGFVTIVVREAVGDRAEGPHEANLFDIQAKYGEVCTLEDVTRFLATTRIITG